MAQRFTSPHYARKVSYRHFGGLRLLLAMLVVLQHFLANLAPEPLATASLPYEFGYVAVLVFFALSGFVISEAADRIYLGRPLAFMANRFLRILPHFVLAMTAAILLHVAFELTDTLRLARHEMWSATEAFAPRNIALNLMSFFPGASRFTTYNFLPIAWAIGVEMAFYLLLAVALALVQMSKKALLRLSLPAACLAIAAAFAPLFILSLSRMAPPMFGFEPYFVYGCALYFALTGGSWVSWLTAATACWGIIWHFLGEPARHPVLEFERAVFTQFALLLVLLGLMTSLASVHIRRFHKVDKALGDFTYPLYLWHVDVMILVLSLTAGYSYAGLIGALALAFIVTYGVGALVDRNLNRLRDAVRGGQVP
jgi:peptidoglycan/LPS O-acetylase OafA/YrhL